MPKVIDDFHGQYEFLSNFNFNPILMHGKIWDTSEHYYQAQKFPVKFVPNGETVPLREQIRTVGSPGGAYRLSHRWKHYWASDFDKIKFTVMSGIVFEKFAQHRTLRKQLLDTAGFELIEGNVWHDNYWGNCRCGKCVQIEGQNRLGQLLMQLRDEFGRMETQQEGREGA